ncbi:hypothetical protein GE21DRAFT_2953 [Neurospora crassa]|uniref:Uncharacterized protein n=2 Tax=Neurospora crassa TaxID=5141 RepID=V5IQY3_NEUCR|nr:hypothetical protein NCU05354 [Neurospora crassa OR74A]ESA43536.1 hypothetical protein NCU05354 [Neurospora crassa OR74A]KHE80055.1 hypothetical protein GE21DRAFT_2953 [Neurospora crassa]CAD01109.1 putative protein [Neurospora crassa]|eukprot:XP_011393564.1 hypothetical protein NCU05354 [Neurospora crassa OR74A]
MLPSSTAVTLSQAPPAPVQWYDHVLRKKYRDPLKLKQALTAMYGEGNYRIKVRADRWIVTIPKELSNIEMDELENSIYSHY